jgi:aminoglycoside phosphotransferase (APT) family kinase protein
MERTNNLLPLLDHLVARRPDDPIEWQGWWIQRVTGGWNNLLFRVTDETRDLVIKFTRSDARNRAAREFYGLTLMQKFAPGLAPVPVLLESERYPHQVVVQQWLEGEPVGQQHWLPVDWQRLSEHYAAIHAITPERVGDELLAVLKPAVLTFSHAEDAVRYVLNHSTRLANEAWTDGLRALSRQLEDARFPTWEEPPCSFDRCDPNIANFLRPPDGRPWASVDWENSGWGDPAFEIGDMMTHPGYKDVSLEQWDRFLQAYAELRPEDHTFLLRAQAYRAIILVRWACLFAGFARQREQGIQDTGRLVAWPQPWWDGVPGEYRRYVREAQVSLAEFSR